MQASSSTSEGPSGHWFQEVVAGLREDHPWDEGRPPYDPARAFTCDRPLPEVLGYYRRPVRPSDQILAGVSLSDAPLGRHGDDEIPNVRVVVLHMIEETAAHSGHPEIARERTAG